MPRFGASGYSCLRDRVCVRAAQNAISGRLCDYDAMGAYVRRVLADVLGHEAMGAKFRVSDNDNTDAAAFHRDAIRAPGASPFELLTCIVYLDDAAMQVIPGSHTRTYGAMDALSSTPTTLAFRAGDVMLFHGELVHRAVLTPSGRRRRVIQIFDVVFRASDAARVAHVVSAGSSAGWWVARAPVLGHLARFVGYLHSMAGYGPFELGVTYLSSEGFSGRLRASHTSGPRPLGMYCTLAPTLDVDRASISASVYTLPQLRISATLVACVAVCAWLLYLLCACFTRARRMHSPPTAQPVRLEIDPFFKK